MSCFDGLNKIKIIIYNNKCIDIYFLKYIDSLKS